MSLVFGKSENESKEEKESHKMHSKADPTKAINEAQPGMTSYRLEEMFWAPLTQASCVVP